MNTLFLLPALLLLACSAPTPASSPAPTSQPTSDYQWKSAPINHKSDEGAKVRFEKPYKLSANVLKNYASIEIRFTYFRKKEDDKLIARVERSAESDALVKAISSNQLCQRRYVDLLISSMGCNELHFLDAKGKSLASFRDLSDFLDCVKDEQGNIRSIVAEFEAFMKVDSK